jgi:P27 family predicted phage terminase small subunit
MGKRGPKKEPTILQLLKGNPGRRPINKFEPQPGRTAIGPPDYLGPVALEKWNTVVPGLIETFVLTDADVTTLARYCVMYESWLSCLKQVRISGEWYAVFHPKTGKMIGAKITPSALMMAKHAIAMLRIEQEFGLTPSSRSGIVASKKQAGPTVDRRVFG